MATHIVLQHASEQLERTVAGLMTKVVVQPLEMIDIGHHQREGDAVSQQVAGCPLEFASIGQPGEPIGARFQARGLEQADGSDPRPDHARQRDELIHRCRLRRVAFAPGDVQHPEEVSVHTNRNAHGGADLFMFRQQRTGVQL